MTPKIEIFDQKFAHFGRFEGSFLTILGVEKVVFWTFSKLFGKCLSIVFRLKRPTFSPLGSREALKNVDKASPGLFIYKPSISTVYNGIVSKILGLSFTFFYRIKIHLIFVI